MGQRPDTVVRPLPGKMVVGPIVLECAQGRTESATLVIRSLQKKELVVERPAGDGNAIWREDDGRQTLTVVISEAGLEVFGLLPDECCCAAGARGCCGAGERRQAPGHGRNGRCIGLAAQGVLYLGHSRAGSITSRSRSKC